MSTLPFRQIHLDFHTSGLIPNIASEFNPDEFAQVLDLARVNSVTVFARCHHGYVYYPSKVNPERIHPNLNYPTLVQDQIKALHKKGIRAPVYTTIQWDQLSSETQPDWLVLKPDGSPTAGYYEATFQRYLCVNSPYRDFLKDHIKEIFEVMPVDGLFLDIVKTIDCSCQHCRKGMIENGYNPEITEERWEYAKEMMKGFKRDLSQFIREINPECGIFYNQGHVSPDTRDVSDCYSHIEVESLPSGEWGYGHFPAAVRYARTLGHDYLGMTGKFHTEWGDMHSFKNEAALQFECFNMLATGAKCSIGDQLHPNGKISQATYDLIGSVYTRVEKLEPWCNAVKPVVDIGVLNPEEFFFSVNPADGPQYTQGACRLLSELRMQYDVIDTNSRFEDYKLIILPDEIPVNDNLMKRLKAFTESGGAIIGTGKSGLNDSGKYAESLYGVEYQGEAKTAPNYIVPTEVIGKTLPKTEHAMYLQGQAVHVTSAEVLVDSYHSYFNRTWEHYCSHRQTPCSGELGTPAVTRKDNTIYFMHPLFSQYTESAPKWVKEMLSDAIEILLANPKVILDNSPSSTIASVNYQPEFKREVVHLLHYVPERKSNDVMIVEDIIPLYNLKVKVRNDIRVSSVKIVPSNESLEFEIKNDYIEFTLPKLNGYEVIELS